MRIEKLELIGFKSFADKIAFNLHPGITCIVGPNGCGKSNIVDAFRWVLGEQSAKSLRGEKMEEVIFNGSSLKKPKGMAEVTMIISGLNGSGGGNGQGQSDNVMVSRRLYRSGESEYMINKNSCRLKDIKDIFLDTGLDFRSYSILEQGRIGEILNSKPYERRFIIEEVAGVMKYKVRRAEALSKLESARTNLLRINDIIAEVRKQINVLDRLARKAERYKKLSSEMHAIELKIARNEYEKIAKALEEIIGEYSSLRENETALSAEISGMESRTEKRRLDLIGKEKGLEQIEAGYRESEKNVAEIERAIAVARNDIDNLREYHARLLAQQEEVIQRSTELSVKHEELSVSSERISGDLESHAEALRQKIDGYRAKEEELADQQDRVEEERREIFRISEEISALRNELGRAQSSCESFARREDTAHREAEDTRSALADIESSISGMEASIHGIGNEVLLLNEKREVDLGELSEAREGMSDLQNRLSGSREDLASYISRLDSLKEIVFESPTRELIASNPDVRLVAMISEVFDVDAEYEKALENILAEKADLFILEAREDIEKTVFSIRGQDFGKSAFIAVTSPLMPFPGGVPEGIAGSVLDHVRVKEGFEGIARNLLGNVYIVKNLGTAFELRESGINFPFVTPEGEVVEPSGAVIVGGGKGVFRRKREIRELEEMIGAKKVFIDNLQEERENLQRTILEKEEGLKAVDASLNELEKEISISRVTIRNAAEEKERMSRKLSYLSLEIEEIAREKESLKSVIAAAEEKVLAAESKKRNMEEETTELQQGIQQKRSEIEEFRAEVTELRLLSASNREKLEAIRNEMDSSLKVIDGLDKKKEELGLEQERVLLRISGRESEIGEKDEMLRGLVAETDKIRVEISRIREEIEKENEDLITVEQGLRSLRQKSSTLTSRISELDVLRAENKMKLENLSLNVRNNYGIEIQNVELLDVTHEEEERLSELRNKVREMGQVNLGTIEEYEELKTRYEFLSGQQEDLTKSIAELEEAISKINSTTRKKLREAFETLDHKFGEVFVTLFGGGRAELVLTDEHNILESGIDINVQPPGKKLQNIHLLSGGEKALTALAIQFASFLIKPTPLCILDEADAPLDESNTERFSRMLNEISTNTQFVVVTHNRTTMSVAQNLYGITMEEAGVSKVISMQLAEV
jgi:chromosome segregation protein